VTTEVLRQRAEIEESIRGRTICDQLRETAEQFPDDPALSQASPDSDGSGPAGWATLSWAQARQQALELAAGFIALGLAPGEHVAIMMPNRTEHVLADFGAVHAGGIPVTFYATLAAEQVGFVAGDCAARIAVLDGADQLARWQPVLASLPALSTIIVRDASACPAGEPYLTWDDFVALGRERLAADPGLVTGRVAALTPADPVTLLYTSGTTGNPKGVLLTHHCVLYEVAAAKLGGTVTPHVRWVSYLPLAHIAERMFSIYLPVSTAGHVHFCPDAQQLIKAVGEVHPTAFFGVPRVWEKIKAGIQALLAGEADPARRAAVEQAMDVGRRYVESTQYGRTTPDDLAGAFRQADAQVLAPIRSLLGLGQADVVSSAAAPLPPEVSAFFAGLGMRILDIYGMTETTGAFTSNTVSEFRMGSVGRAFAGTEIMIADDGEILTRGPLNTPGYLNRPDLTAELIDADGWLHTGDIGRLDEDGFLSVVDRKKELIITAGGENVPPYVVALLTLDAEVAPVWARARGIEAGSLAALAQNPAVLAEIEVAVATANQQLARVQQVKRWRLLPVEWTAESEELTPTLKLKRRVVHAKYSDDIDILYAG
jgi:long-chain acyl-CoA synthetase